MATQLKLILRAYSGIGNPTDGDRLVTQVTTFKIDQIYINKTDGSVWIRKAVNGVAADWETMEQGGGGGGESLLQSATVTLTDAQIRDIQNTPVTIVPAPGAGKAILLIAALAQSSIVQAYTAASFSMELTMPSSKYQSCILKAENILSGSGFGKFLVPYAKAGTGDWSGEFVTDSGIIAVTDIENRPLQLQDEWGAGSQPTGGDPANTLKITAYYVVVDV